MNASDPAIGDLEWGQCMLTGVLIRLLNINLLQCAKYCRRTPKCFSINYRYKWDMCDLVSEYNTDTSNIDKNQLTTEIGCVHSYISSWSEELVPQCVNIICTDGYTCNPNGSCDVAYCHHKLKPHNAFVVEKFGTYRNKGYGIHHKCIPMYHMVGQKIAVCTELENGKLHWDIKFACYPEYCPKDYIFDPELSVCFKLYPTSSTYSKSVAACEKEGSKLMKIDSQKTQTMVEYHLREWHEQVPNTNYEYIFIQGKNTEEGVWIFDDSTFLEFFNWDEEQRQPDLTEDTNYLSLGIHHKFKWHDVKQDFTGIPLCQKQEPFIIDEI